MSTNDILRKYLDILSEEEAPAATAPAATAPTGEIPTIAPMDGKGSIKKVMEAVKEFQQEVGIDPADGIINPRTLAEILSQSGTLGKDEVAKLKAGANQQATEKEGEPVSEGVDGQGHSKHDQLTDKAALHLGYAHGLQGHEHQCPHGVGTSAHSHYSHGFNEGLKECGMGKIWTNPAF
jgi:hypothetical protein